MRYCNTASASCPSSDDETFLQNLIQFDNSAWPFKLQFKRDYSVGYSFDSLWLECSGLNSLRYPDTNKKSLALTITHNGFDCTDAVTIKSDAPSTIAFTYSDLVPPVPFDVGDFYTFFDNSSPSACPILLDDMYPSPVELT